MPKLIGWDVGGAHLKAVLLDCDGDVKHVQQLICPLWQGMDKLEAAVASILHKFEVTPNEMRHAVTMTGELVDLFLNRHDGVLQISQCMTRLLGKEVLFYCLPDTSDRYAFVTIEAVVENTKLIASANWHASASLLAETYPSALLVDIGSTTTDIIVIDNGKVIDSALTDATRMQEDKLVYTGIIRTPIMAVTQKLILDGQEINVAAEYFATTADIYRLTGELQESVDMAETADGESKTVIASARRLARMVGHDVEDKSLKVWKDLALDCRARQLAQITLAVKKHLKSGVTIVGAGAGNFLVEAIAQALNHPYAGFSALLSNDASHDLEVCLPAYAVARLALLRNATS